jgi:hypothetical protein
MSFESETQFGRARRRRFRLFLFLILLVGAAALVAGALRVGPAPAIELRGEPKAIGRATAVELRVAEPKRGLSRVRIELEQAGAAEVLVDESYAPRPGWKLWGPFTAEKSYTVELGKSAHPNLREAPATLRVTAERAGGWLRSGAPSTFERTLPVQLTPPALEIVSTQHYVAQGGAEVVVYRVGESSVHDGVEIGDWFFPGYPMPAGSGGGARDRFALFAVPYDVASAANVLLVAADAVGNRRTMAFVDQFFPAPPKADVIELDDKFLGKVVPEILAETPDLKDQGDLVANYLQINRDLRRKNNAELRLLAERSRPEFLWNSAFLALPGGQVMSSFADRRTYRYGGRDVDRQDHLGFDLASVAHADVPAANRGVVVLARYFGIFGNAVVVDHGYGLMSLYAHLSSIAVKEGDTVERGARLGQSGATGLAAGDHLHFSFLLHGLPVRPAEWWDAHWIQDRLKRKLGAALPFAG